MFSLRSLSLAVVLLTLLQSVVQGAPLTIAKDARTERDFLKEQRAWAERALVTPFRERAKGKGWEKQALEFVGRALDVWPGDRTTVELPELSREGQALETAGCGDPLVGYLTTWARWLATDEYYGSREGFDKWMRAAEKLPGTHVLAVLCGQDFYNADTVVKLGVGDLPKRLMSLIAEAWQDGGYVPGEDPVFVRQLFSDRNTPFFDQHFNQLWDTLKQVNLPEWAAKTILGRVEIERAWKQRGVKFSDAVSDQQWKGFREHLAEARKHLIVAAEQRPDQPVAAVGMIRLTMGQRGDEGVEDPRVWFDRAIEAQCDYSPAYGQYALAQTPRWGGSFDEMVKLARSCAETARFDTDVPLRAMTVLNRAYEEVGDFWDLYRKPEIAPTVLRIFQGYAKEPSRTAIRKRDLADLAVYAHASGNDAAAAAALQEYGNGVLPHSAVVKLHDLRIDEPILRADVALLSSPLRADFEKAEKARVARQFGAAEKGYAALLPRATGIAASRLRGLAGNVAVEEKLAAGEWATIPSDPDLSGWIQRSGAWFATAEGMPAIKEADGPVRIIYDARVGANFEMKATLKIEGEPKARWFQGVVFGDGRERFYKANWHGAFVRFDKGRPIGTARCFFREFVTGLPAMDCPLLDTNEFTLQVLGEKLSWTVNGKRVHQNVELKGLHEDDRIGFGSFKHTWGITTSLQKLEVRRLPAPADAALER